MASIKSERDLPMAVEVVELSCSADEMSVNLLPRKSKKETAVNEIQERYQKGHREKIVSKYQARKKRKRSYVEVSQLGSSSDEVKEERCTFQGYDNLDSGFQHFVDSDVSVKLENTDEEGEDASGRSSVLAVAELEGVGSQDSDSAGEGPCQDTKRRTREKKQYVVEDNWTDTQQAEYFVDEVYLTDEQEEAFPTNKSFCQQEDNACCVDMYSEEEHSPVDSDNLSAKSSEAQPGDHSDLELEDSDHNLDDILLEPDSEEDEDPFPESMQCRRNCHVRLTRLKFPLKEGNYEWVQHKGACWRLPLNRKSVLGETERTEAKQPDAGSAKTVKKAISPIRPPSYDSPRQKKPVYSSSFRITASGTSTPKQSSTDSHFSDSAPHSKAQTDLSSVVKNRKGNEADNANVKQESPFGQNQTDNEDRREVVINCSPSARPGSFQSKSFAESKKSMPAKGVSSPVKSEYGGNSDLRYSLDYRSADKDILPVLHTPRRLGLTDDAENDWSADAAVDLKEDADAEDMDVLSLYDYDTFLDNEDETLDEAGTLVSQAHGSLSHQRGKPSQDKNLKGDAPKPAGHSETNNKEKGKKTDQTEALPKSTTVCCDQLKTERTGSPQQAKSTSLGKDTGERKRSGTNEKVEFKIPQNVPLLQSGSKAGKREKQKISLNQPENMSFQRRHHSMVQVQSKRELEVELKLHINRRDIVLATETVGKIHMNQTMKIDRVLVFNLLHLLIREGAVPQLMKIFTFVCNQGVFNEEVCNAYIRLGCSECTRYDRQLKNVFQFLRRFGIRPAGDCLTSLLSFYCDHKDDPKMFWLMLSYFENFPCFSVPLPLLEKAISKLLQRKDPGAITKFNQWVLTTKAGSLKKLDLPVIGRMAIVLQPASMARLQTLFQTPQQDVDADSEEEAPPELQDAVLGQQQNYKPQDFQFYCRHIQDFGTSRDWDRLAQLFFELCQVAIGNCPLLINYAEVFLHQQDVVVAMDSFLHSLYRLFEQGTSTDPTLQVDKLALAHLTARVLDGVSFTRSPEFTLTLLDTILQCPLVQRKLLFNCEGVGLKVAAACLQTRQALQACKTLKGLRLGKDDKQATSLVNDVLRQLVAERKLDLAFSLLRTVSSRAAIDVADATSLTVQLAWHALNVANIPLALDLLDWHDQQPTPPAPAAPPPLLRAVLVGSVQGGFTERSRTLFERLKRAKVYNDQPLVVKRRYLCGLSTMLTPDEIRLCLLDRLDELYHKLCTLVSMGSTLGPMDRDFAVEVVPEHDPQTLALPYLALAPRSAEHTAQVVISVMSNMSPPLLASFDDHLALVVVDPVSLVDYLKHHDSSLKGLKRGLSWSDNATFLPPGPSQSPAAFPLTPKPGPGSRQLYQPPRTGPFPKAARPDLSPPPPVPFGPKEVQAKRRAVLVSSPQPLGCPSPVAGPAKYMLHPKQPLPAAPKAMPSSVGVKTRSPPFQFGGRQQSFSPPSAGQRTARRMSTPGKPVSTSDGQTAPFPRRGNKPAREMKRRSSAAPQPHNKRPFTEKQKCSSPVSTLTPPRKVLLPTPVLDLPLKSTEPTGSAVEHVEMLPTGCPVKKPKLSDHLSPRDRTVVVGTEQWRASSDEFHLSPPEEAEQQKLSHTFYHEQTSNRSLPQHDISKQPPNEPKQQAPFKRPVQPSVPPNQFREPVHNQLWQNASKSRPAFVSKADLNKTPRQSLPSPSEQFRESDPQQPWQKVPKVEAHQGQKDFSEHLTEPSFGRQGATPWHSSSSLGEGRRMTTQPSFGQDDDSLVARPPFSHHGGSSVARQPPFRQDEGSSVARAPFRQDESNSMARQPRLRQDEGSSMVRPPFRQDKGNSMARQPPLRQDEGSSVARAPFRQDEGNSMAGPPFKQKEGGSVARPFRQGKGNSMDRQPPFRQNESSSIARQPPFRQNEGSSMDRQPPFRQNEGSSMDRQPPFRQNEVSSMDRQPPFRQNEGSSMVRQPPFRQNEGSSMDRQPPFRQNEGSPMARHPFRQDEGSSMAKPPFRQEESSSISRQPPFRQDKGNSMTRQPPFRQNKGSSMDRPPFNQDEGNSMARHPPFRQDEGNSMARHPPFRQDEGNSMARPQFRQDKGRSMAKLPFTQGEDNSMARHPFRQEEDNSIARPPFRQEEDNSMARPPFRQGKDNSMVRPPFRQEEDNSMARPPFRQDEDNSMARPPFRQDEGSSMARPPFRQDEGSSMARPPFRQDEDNSMARHPFRQDEGSSMAKLPFRQGEDNSMARPPFRKGKDNSMARPPFRQEEDNSMAKPPFRQEEDNSMARPPFRQGKGSSMARHPFRQDEGSSMARPPFRQEESSSVSRQPPFRQGKGSSMARQPPFRQDEGSSVTRPPFRQDEGNSVARQLPFRHADQPREMMAEQRLPSSDKKQWSRSPPVERHQARPPPLFRQYEELRESEHEEARPVRHGAEAWGESVEEKGQSQRQPPSRHQMDRSDVKPWCGGSFYGEPKGPPPFRPPAQAQQVVRDGNMSNVKMWRGSSLEELDLSWSSSRRGPQSFQDPWNIPYQQELSQEVGFNQHPSEESSVQLLKGSHPSTAVPGEQRESKQHLGHRITDPFQGQQDRNVFNYAHGTAEALPYGPVSIVSQPNPVPDCFEESSSLLQHPVVQRSLKSQRQHQCSQVDFRKSHKW